MKHITIAQKLLALVILAAALVGVMTYHEITEFRAQQFKDRHAVIEMHVNNAQSVLKHYHDMAVSGEMDPAEARATALEAVGAMRYEASGYFFLLDFQGIFRVHPTARLVGTSGMELKDKSGELFIKKLIDIARAGGGISSYQWNKPGEDPDTLFEKVSYASAFDPWQLVIGTGVYVDDIDALVAEEINAAIKFGGGVVLVLIVFALLISRSITGQLAKVRASLDAVSKDDTEMTIPFTGARTEAGRMANSIKSLQDSVRDRLELEEQQAESQRALDAEREANQAAQDAEAERQKRVVATIGQALESVASGDLSVRCDDLGAADEALRSHFNDAIGKLESAMAQVNAKGNDISMSKDEIRRASVELSQRTERQAASLEETSAALEELSSSVRLTAEGARDAAKRVVSVASETETSDAIVNDAISAMSAIEQSSAQISNIIGVIEDIAFQTNLLALNAGVEAARAGESGKGFAVVAQEVRELAQRSSAAAKDVKDQIVQSSTQVDNGVKLVGDTGEALKRIFVEIKAVRDSVSSIADSASEQDTTLRSLTSSVNEMDSTTQQNAAMAEETTACTEALATDTEQLIKMINRFRVSPQSAGAGGEYRMAS